MSAVSRPAVSGEKARFAREVQAYVEELRQVAKCVQDGQTRGFLNAVSTTPEDSFLERIVKTDPRPGTLGLLKVADLWVQKSYFKNPKTGEFQITAQPDLAYRGVACAMTYARAAMKVEFPPQK